MSLKNLERLRILEGSDMFPCILPTETLLLDKKAEIKIGDVVLFENRFGLKIAHRLIHKFGNYYFTRGDNCPYLNMPRHKKDIFGKVLRKHRKVKQNKLMNIFLDLFLAYYTFYKSLFDIKKKKHFFLLKLITRSFAPLESIHYPSDYDNDSFNKFVYGIINVPNNSLHYYLRKAYDNRISFDKSIFLNNDPEKNNISKEELKNILDVGYEEISGWLKGHNLVPHFIHRSNLGVIDLRDLMALRQIFSDIDIKRLAFKNLNEYEVVGTPLILLYLFDQRYNNAKDEDLAKFVKKHYPSQLKKITAYMERRNYEMPIPLLNMYKECAPFKFIKHLTPKTYQTSNTEEV
jgi:hypothetical protein